ncbi:MAG: TauD/TfdA family dioxygenase [Dehalococcoidia bacterium]
MTTGILTRVERIDYNHHIGTELRGLRLLDLDDAAIEEIRQLAAERGVLFFRDQAMTLDQQVELGRRLGTLHVHPAAKGPEGYPEVLLVHTDADSKYTAGETWHTDVSCEEQPPALSMLRVEVIPSVGGDTLWSSMYAAYDLLSDPMKEFLSARQAIHTSDQVYGGRYSMNDTKTPSAIHPAVRTHPLTGRRALYINSGFTTRIKGVTRRESDAILKMLFDHVAYEVECQVRFRWEENSVALWDNRCVQHYASWDYFPETRTGYRVTTVGERPYLAG